MTVGGKMIRFARLQEDHLEMVMKWRVSQHVTRYMSTDVVYDMEEQRSWFNRIVNDDTCRYWVIFYMDAPVGVVNLAAIDRNHLRCSAGYYIGDADCRQIGGMIPPYIYNHLFREMEFRKIYGEVLSGNTKVLQMHKLHGFRQVGVYRDHVLKNGRFHDVVLIELLSESWLRQKRYQRYVTELP